MPPHARMSLVQVLLLRAISRFWKEPYQKRWFAGYQLHDACAACDLVGPA